MTLCYSARGVVEIEMETSADFFEGKLVVIQYIEADYWDEGDAVLLYQVQSGRAVPLYGILNLPDGVDHNHHYEQLDEVIRLIHKNGQSVVYAPWVAFEGAEFFKQKLGYFDISDDGECWGEFTRVSIDYERYLAAHNITVGFVDVETLEVIE